MVKVLVLLLYPARHRGSIHGNGSGGTAAPPCTAQEMHGFSRCTEGAGAPPSMTQEMHGFDAGAGGKAARPLVIEGLLPKVSIIALLHYPPQALHGAAAAAAAAATPSETHADETQET
eukprot:1160847-Pelagomonas_calceolata.AAC.2